MAAKTKAGFRADYITSLRQVVKKFSATVASDSISDAATSVEAWIDSQAWSASTKRSNIGRLASFFTFSKKRGWSAFNPCDSIEMPRVLDKTPFVWSVNDRDKIMAFTHEKHPAMIAFATLVFILGLRPAEARRGGWDGIDEERVAIDASASKVWKRRVVPICDEAKKWFKIAREKFAKLPISKSTERRYIRSVRDFMGLEAWPQDSMRHTAATVMLRKHEDAGKVARWLGNSERILLKHYVDI